MHFLNFKKEINHPISLADLIDNTSKRSYALRRKKYQSLLLKQLWTKWRRQYLLDPKMAYFLQNSIPQTESKVHDAILIEKDRKNKLLWKLGKIERAIPGWDNHIYSYEVKPDNGLLQRTVQHLYPLELV